LSVRTRWTVIPAWLKKVCARVQNAAAVSFFSSARISL
jgi:hypothetical protein